MIRDAQAAVDALLAELYPPDQEGLRRRLRTTPIVLDDEEVLRKARNAANGWKFKKLHDEGNTSGYPSHSEADMAEVCMLIFWCGGDREQIVRIFEQSALHRPEKRGNYVERTVDAALENYRGDFYDPKKQRPELEKKIEPLVALLNAPIWTQRKSPIAHAVFTTLVSRASKHGTPTGNGVRIGVSMRDLAMESGTSTQTLRTSALPFLVKMGLVKFSSQGSGRRAGAYLLKVPRSLHISNSHSSNVQTSDERAQLNRLRSGWSRSSYTKRVSKSCALPVLHLLGADGCTLTLAELVTLTGRRESSVRNSMRSLLGANLVTEPEAEVYRLRADFWERFEDRLRDSGVIRTESIQKRQYEEDRLMQAGWMQTWEQGEEFWFHAETGEIATRRDALAAAVRGEL